MPKATNNTGGQSGFSTAPVTAAQVSAADAEWLDSPGVERVYSIKRSLLYELASLGLIRGVSLRRKGQVKGKRLWHSQSIRDYLRSQMEGQN
jgi:hypothetical protein